MVKPRARGLWGYHAAPLMDVTTTTSPYAMWVALNTPRPQPKKSKGIGSFGRYMEPWIAQEVETHHRLKLLDDHYIYQHLQYRFMFSRIDRRTPTGVLVELTTSRKEWDEVPDYLYAQIQHNLLVTNMHSALVAVLSSGSFGVKLFELARDNSYITSLIEKEQTFWEMVRARVVPPIDGSKHTSAVSCENYQVIDGTKIEVLPTAHELIIRRAIAKREQQEAVRELRRIESEIHCLLGGAEVGTYQGKPMFVRSLQTFSKVDVRALEAAHPDIAAQFTVVTQERTLRIKPWPRDGIDDEERAATSAP